MNKNRIEHWVPTGKPNSRSVRNFLFLRALFAWHSQLVCERRLILKKCMFVYANIHFCICTSCKKISAKFYLT